jgi:hypothetical protein
MYRFTLMAAVALALAAAAAFSPAVARMTLSQCIGKNGSCRDACYMNSPVLPGNESHDPRLRACLRQCGSSHSVCVDAAMTLSPRGSDGSSQPPKGAINNMPTGGLLDSRSGFGAAGPAPGGTVAPRPPAPGPIIR